MRPWFVLLVGLLLLAAIVSATCAVLVHQGAIEPPRRVTAPAPDLSMSPEASAAQSAAGVDDNDPLGVPVSARPLQILHKQWFTIGYDNARREPAWTSYHLSGPIRFHGHEKRPQRFVTDTEVQAAATHDDYTSSGYDRGHMTPAFAMWSRGGEDAMRATFITSNIVPQAHAMNAGVWEDIETLIAGRDGLTGGWAETYGDVWVTDGPVHRRDEPTIPGGEPVPAQCGWWCCATTAVGGPRSPSRCRTTVSHVNPPGF